ncbi:MAG: histidine kinase [Burkholderiaceae bacterium]|nr:histidine kinase [Burkholderiaceae bacterium]
MSAVLPLSAEQGRQTPLALVWQAWRSTQPRELMVWLLIGLLYGAVDLGAIYEVWHRPEALLAMARQLLLPVLAALLLALCWLPADRSAPEHPHRAWRLAFATLVGAALSVLLVRVVIDWLQWPNAMDLMYLAKGKPPMPIWHWSSMLGDLLGISLSAGLAVAVHEMNLRLRRSEAAVQRSLQTQSVLTRKAMAARLATMQAQIDPQFLFDTLVGIEQDYQHGKAAAAPRLEQLIRHLRVALPRLRDMGSTLEAEAELLDSYLAVRLGEAAPRLQRDWPAELGGLPLPPMVLLPLLQRALQLCHDELPSCGLQAELAARGWRISLNLGRPGLCGDAAEMATLQQRLQALTGQGTALRCESGDHETSFILDLQP